METAIRLGHEVRDNGSVDTYNCEVCRMQGRDKHRACFRFRERDQVRRIRVAGRDVRPTDDVRWMNKSGVWHELFRLEKALPRNHVLQHFRLLGVCPEGMIDDVRADYLNREMISETYKAPPVAGGVEDWPAHLFDAFTVIQQTQNQIQAEKVRELRSKQ